MRSAALLLLSAVGIAASGCSESSPDDTSSDGATDARPLPDVSPRDGVSDADASQDGLASADRSAPDDSWPDTATPDDSSRDTSMPDDGAQRDATALDGPEEKRDVDGGAPDADAPACPGDALWNANSAGFRLSAAPSPSIPVPPDPECTSPMRVYEFDAPERTLSQVGCVNFRSVARVAHLDGVATSQIVSALQAMRTICSSACRNDVMLQTLAVRDAAGCVQQSYDIDVCTTSRIPPYVAVDDVAGLYTLLHGILATVCGGSSSNGVCDPGDAGTNLCKISWPPADAGADAPRDSAVDTRADAFDGDAPIDGDGAICARELVGRNFSSFKLTIDGGPSSPRPPDGGCAGTTMMYEVSLQEKTLLAYGCMNARSAAQRVELVEAQIDAIVAKVAPMRATCETTCSGDESQGFLSFADCSGKGLGWYSSNYSPTCNLPPVPPYIDTIEMSGLGGLLSQIVANSCRGPADAASPGACSPRCRQIIR